MTPSLVLFSFKLHWYISSLSIQFHSRGQASFCWQLHLGWSWIFSSGKIYRNSFEYESKPNSTELSKHFWEMKRKDITKPIMHWSVIDHTKRYKNGSKRCNLCLTEKYHILTSPVNLINKRLFRNVVMKTSFISLIAKQSHWMVSKTWSDN